MANPTQNWVSNNPSTNINIMQDSVNDLSIQSAVIGTGGGSHTTFDLLKANANQDLMDDAFRVRNTGIFSTNDMRGYPKPTVTMSFGKEEVGTIPSSRYERIICTPTLNGIVGFDVTITINVFEYPGFNINDQDATNTSVSFTFAAGSLVPTSNTNAIALGGDKYRINQNTPTIGEPYWSIQITQLSESVPLYYGEVAVYNTSARYYSAQTVYNYDIYVLNGVPGCQTATQGNPVNVYSLDSALTIQEGTRFYTSTNPLAGTIPDDDYIFYILGDGNYNYGITDGSFVDTIVNCEGVPEA